MFPRKWLVSNTGIPSNNTRLSVGAPPRMESPDEPPCKKLTPGINNRAFPRSSFEMRGIADDFIGLNAIFSGWEEACKTSLSVCSTSTGSSIISTGSRKIRTVSSRETTVSSLRYPRWLNNSFTESVSGTSKLKKPSSLVIPPLFSPVATLQ